LVSFGESGSHFNTGWRSQLHGCAFEIKTRSQKKQNGARQLYHYSMAGYQPIMVAPGWLLVEEGPGTPSYEYIAQLLNHGSCLEIVSADPLRFTQSTSTRSTLALPGLREFLMRTEVPTDPD
jgi:hypothetical protein